MRSGRLTAGQVRGLIGIVLAALTLGVAVSPASAALNTAQKQQVDSALIAKPAPAQCKQKDEATLTDVQECRNAIKAKVTAKGDKGQELDGDIDAYLISKVSYYSHVKVAAKVTTAPKLKYTDLDEVIKSGTDAGKVRTEAAGVMGITDGTHGNHGANYSGNDTVKVIIKDVFKQVKDPNQKNTVAQKVIKAYGFDPR